MSEDSAASVTTVRPRRRRAVVLGALVVALAVAIPIARMLAARAVEARIGKLAGALGLDVRYADLSVGLLGSAAFEGLTVQREGFELLRCERVEVGVRLRTLRPDRVWSVGCRARVRLRDDRPIDAVALRDAWRARPRTEGGGGAGGGRAVPQFRADALTVEFSAEGGRSVPLSGTAWTFGEFVGDASGAQGTWSVQGPVQGEGSLVVRRDGESVEVQLRTQRALTLPPPDARLRWLRLSGATLRLGPDERRLELEQVAAEAKGLVARARRVVVDGPGPRVQIAGASIEVPTLGGLPSAWRNGIAALELADATAARVRVEGLEVPDLSRLLAGKVELRGRGLTGSLGPLGVDVASWHLQRDGAGWIGPKSPVRLQLLRPALRVAAAEPSSGPLRRRFGARLPRWLRRRVGSLRRRLAAPRAAVATKLSLPPAAASRPLWRSNPEKIPPATARFAPALGSLDERADDGLKAFAGARDALARLPLQIDVRGGSVTVDFGAHRLGANAIDVGVEPRRPGRPGRLAAAARLFIDDRHAGSLDGSLILDGVGAPVVATLHFDGAEFARAASVLMPRLAIGARPELGLDLWLTAAPGRGGELRVGMHARDVGVDWWRVATSPLTDFSLDVQGMLQIGSPGRPMRLDIADVRFGGSAGTDRLRLAGWATLRGEKRPVVDLSVWLPEQDCGAALRALPPSLVPTVGTVRAKGRLAGWADLHLDVAHPWYSEIDLGWDDARCELLDTGKLGIAALAEPFVRPANEDGKLREDQPIGPKSGSWVSLGAMPRWLSYAMVTTEDGSFWQHRGLNTFLLNRAIRLDLHAGRFVYGGSTITQQLAKNLFFRRDKTLLRKLEEALATWLMERRLGKQRILEIYCNAVEMAPDHYGVVRGAELYFGKRPEKLGPVEAAWLGILKPCPRCAHTHFRARSMPYWYQKRLLEILTRMWRNQMIDDARFAALQNTVPQFDGWPEEKLAQRSNWPVPEKKEPEPRRLDRGR
ncbi:MAG: hypothetical protein RIT45_2730 [Pseudomonadota bacterium]